MWVLEISFQREVSQCIFKYYAIQIVLWVHRRWFRSFKGCWVFEEMEHGNLTSNQVILYQEIQFPGMDIVFFPHTLPVYPHPASQRFLFLIHFPLPCQRPQCPLWRSASLKNLSQPSVTDVPGHLPLTPVVHTYTGPLVNGVNWSTIFDLHHVYSGTKYICGIKDEEIDITLDQKRLGITVLPFLVPQTSTFYMIH